MFLDKLTTTWFLLWENSLHCYNVLIFSQDIHKGKVWIFCEVCLFEGKKVNQKNCFYFINDFPSCFTGTMVLQLFSYLLIYLSAPLCYMEIHFQIAWFTVFFFSFWVHLWWSLIPLQVWNESKSATRDDKQSTKITGIS